MELLPLMQIMPPELIPVVGFAIMLLTLYRAIAPLFKKPEVPTPPKDEFHRDPNVKG